ncbi:MAG: Crp/Fnr family transcriptional regulator [Terriglobia bacterium]
MTPKQEVTFTPKNFFGKLGHGKNVIHHPRKQVIFSQGDPGDAIYFIQKGRVKLAVSSPRGKEAVIALMGPQEFFGEACLNGQVRRMETATVIEDSLILHLPKELMLGLLQADQEFSEAFIHYLLTRNVRIQEDLVDQLFNSSEKRLARILLLLAHFGKDETAEVLVPKISQETLAEMVGTTRSRVSYFMNKFRKLGFIEYNGGLKVHNSLLNVVLHD